MQRCKAVFILSDIFTFNLRTEVKHLYTNIFETMQVVEGTLFFKYQCKKTFVNVTY